MAKKDNLKPKRLNTKEILELSLEDISKATKKELSKYVSTLASTANKRIKRLEETGLSPYSEAYQAVQRGGKRGQGRFGAKGKTRNQLQLELKREFGFLTAKTSTVKQARKRYVYTKERYGIDDVNTIKNLWELFNKYKKENPAMFRILDSNQIVNLANNIVESEYNKPLEEKMKIMEEKIENLYLENSEIDNPFDYDYEDDGEWEWDD